MHQPAHRSLGGKAGDNVRRRLRRLCFGVRGWNLGPRAVDTWHPWLCLPASAGSPRRRSDSLSLPVWSGLVWSLCSSSSGERGWTKKIENQNADESEDIIVILAYFSVFGVEKGCNLTTFSSLLMSLAGSGILGIQSLLSEGQTWVLDF